MTDERATETTVTEKHAADDGRTGKNSSDASQTGQRKQTRNTDERGDPAGSEATDEQGDSAESRTTDGQDGPVMDPRVKASLLWGLVGLLAFLVLVQGYELAASFRYPLAVKAGAALFVGVGATGLSYVAEPRLFG